jgi:hypothetical protein
MTVDIVAASLLGAEVAVMVEAVAAVAPRLAGECPDGSGRRREGERQGDDADRLLMETGWAALKAALASE